MKHIENVQKRALKIIVNERISDYNDLLKKAKTCTIETRWKRQLVTEVYKDAHGLTHSYISDMFQEKNLLTGTLTHRSIAGLGTSEVGIRMWRAITT